MKPLLLVLMLFASTRCTPNADTVYLCDSPNATRYHLNEHCRGLSNCNHHIIKTTLAAAKAKHLTLCHWETNH